MCGSVYFILIVWFSKIKVCQNQIISSAFAFTEEGKGQIVEAEDTKSSRTCCKSAGLRGGSAHGGLRIQLRILSCKAMKESSEASPPDKHNR